MFGVPAVLLLKHMIECLVFAAASMRRIIYSANELASSTSIMLLCINYTKVGLTIGYRVEANQVKAVKPRCLANSYILKTGYNRIMYN